MKRGDIIKRMSSVSLIPFGPFMCVSKIEGDKIFGYICGCDAKPTLIGLNKRNFTVYKKATIIIADDVFSKNIPLMGAIRIPFNKKSESIFLRRSIVDVIEFRTLTGKFIMVRHDGITIRTTSTGLKQVVVYLANILDRDYNGKQNSNKR